MSNSSLSTSHSKKIQLTVSPKLHWLSLWNDHRTRFGNISKRIDGVLSRTTPSQDPVRWSRLCVLKSVVESRKHVSVSSPRLLPSLPNNVRQPPITLIPVLSPSQKLYHIIGGICQLFSFSLVAFISSDIRVNASSSTPTLPCRNLPAQQRIRRMQVA